MNVLPVIVGGEGDPIAIVQLQNWIFERVSDAEVMQGRANGAHQDVRAVIIKRSNDGSSDENIIVRLNQAAGTNVTQLRVRSGIEIINFDQAYAGAVIFTTQENCISTR